MLEIRSAQSSIIHCFAEPDVLDTLRAPENAMAFRIARGELMCLGAHQDGPIILTALSAVLKDSDPHALLLDRSDAWAVLTLSGPDRAKAFARLCTSPLPQAPGFLQGAIGTVPAKAVVVEDRIHVMVSSNLGHHIRERILEACGDFAPLELPASPFVAADAKGMV